MSIPLVSVIIPVYNVEKYLKQCLDSIIEQTLSNFEIICVNDGSTDNSLHILKEYEKKDSRFRVISQNNQFAGVARNKGLEIANGKYVFFLDGDDFCKKDLLKLTVDLAEDTNADLVVFDHYRYDNKTSSVKQAKGIVHSLLPKETKIFNYKDVPDRIMSIINPVPWNKLIRKSFIQKYRLEFEEFSSTNDITFAALCAASASKIAYIEKPLISYRVNLEGSITSTKQYKLDNVIQALLQIDIKAKNLFNYNIIKHSVQYFIIANLYFALHNYTGESYSESYKNFFAESGKIFFGLPLFYLMQKEDINNDTLWEFFVQSRCIAEKSFDRTYFPRVIVSMTSYPKRINTVCETIKTMLCQTMMPDKIVLWLAQSQFPNFENDLPQNLLSLVSNVVNVKWTKDLKSYKKLLPSLQEYPNDIIVTIDDDLLFDSHIIEHLLRAYKKEPYYIHCHRITAVSYYGLNSISVVPDAKKVYPRPTYLHKLSGGAGCLYPPHCLHPDVMRESLLLRLAPTNDDIWFWLMGALNGYRVNLVENHISTLSYIPGTQEEALWRINDRGEKLFYSQLKNVLSYYPILKDILMYEQIEMNKLKNEDKGKYDKTVEHSFDLQHYQTEISVLRKKVFELSDEIRNIHASVTYKIGRMITWIPRMVRGMIRCYEQNGFSYTIRQIFVHLHVIKNVESKTELSKPCYSSEISVPQNVDSSVTQIGITKDYNFYFNLAPNEYEKELKLWYKRVMKQELDLDNPKTFNEKIQWLKLYDSTPLKTQLADKYLVREWVSERIGSDHLIPLLGVWKSFDDINFDALPQQFVLKMNNASGWNVLVRSKDCVDMEEIREKFNTWSQKNFAFVYGLELHYMNIPQRIIAEKYIADLDGDIFDYRFFCFGGKPKYVWVDIGSGTKHHKRNIYDLNWKLQDYGVNYPPITPAPIKPKTFDEMIRYAERLSAEFAFVRVDFYSVKDHVYFGEMTFTPQSGTGKWEAEEQNRHYGELIQLPPKQSIPQKKFKESKHV